MGMVKAGVLVSIHAPVKVRTSYIGIDYHTNSFNPRTREGANDILLIVLIDQKQFQSTHP